MRTQANPPGAHALCRALSEQAHDVTNESLVLKSPLSYDLVKGHILYMSEDFAIKILSKPSQDSHIRAEKSSQSLKKKSMKQAIYA